MHHAVFRSRHLLALITLSLLAVAVAVNVPTRHAAGESLYSPNLIFDRTLTVDSTDPDGVDTFLFGGIGYVFEVSGTYYWGLGYADGECSEQTDDPVYRRGRLDSVNSSMLDVTIDGKNIGWQPEEPDAEGCSATHEYRTRFDPVNDGLINLRVADTVHADNDGELTVNIFRDPGIPDASKLVDAYTVATNVPYTASSVQLVAGQRYRVVVSGSYDFGLGFAGATADAECTSVGEAPGQRRLLGLVDDPTLNEDQHDLYLNGRPVDWVPTEVSPFSCNDDDHGYFHDFEAETTNRLYLGVDDTNHGDNRGELTVEIFELAGDEIGAPDLVPTIGAELVTEAAINVNSADPDGSNAILPFLPGQTYVLEVTGSYEWGLGSADAECSNNTEGIITAPDATNRRERPGLPKDLLDLLVAGQPVDWLPMAADPENCANDGENTYRTIFTEQDGRLANFRVNDTIYEDNSGFLTVRVFRVVPATATTTPYDEFEMYASSPETAGTVGLVSGRTYRVQVAGTYDFGLGGQGITADAECTNVAGGPGLREALQVVLGSPGNDLHDVYVDGRPVDWVPMSPSAANCDDETHTYHHDFVARDSAPIRLSIADNAHSDNRGVLEVKVFELSGPPSEPPAGLSPEMVFEQRVTVNSSDADGTVAPIPLLPGETYAIVVDGLYQYDQAGHLADAECSDGPSSTTFERERTDISGAPADLFDLLLNDEALDWQAEGAVTATGCSTDHRYSHVFTEDIGRIARLRINEVVYQDNSGVLSVEIYRFVADDTANEIPFDSFVVQGNRRNGATSNRDLVAGRSYRIAVEGLWSFSNSMPGVSADAECTNVGGAPGSPEALGPAVGGPGEDTHDVYVNGAPVTWTPFTASPAGCDDSDHRYYVDITPTSTGPLHLAMKDNEYSDNSGSVEAKIFELP